MSSAKQNQQIARLIVGAMSIDGSMDKKEREKVAGALGATGLGELVAYVGAAIDEADGTFNMYEECKALRESLGGNAEEVSPLVFRAIVNVVAHDRFVSANEAAYLSAMAKRLGLNVNAAQEIFRQVIAARKSRLEVAASGVDEVINPHLKQLLSFKGAEDLVGEVDDDSIHEMMHQATEAMSEGAKVCLDEVQSALTILGLGSNAKLAEAEAVWKETIDNLNLPKMADLGETFVSAAINRISRINDAYKTILHFHESSEEAKKKV